MEQAQDRVKYRYSNCETSMFATIKLLVTSNFKMSISYSMPMFQYGQ